MRRLFFVNSEHFECDFDGQIFKTKNRLLSHMKKHKMRVKCQICDVEIQPKYMSQHIRDVHTDERAFQCQIC